jgi:hypothetical protein
MLEFPGTPMLSRSIGIRRGRTPGGFWSQRKATPSMRISLDNPKNAASWMTRARGGGIWAPGGVSSNGKSLFAATGNTFDAPPGATAKPSSAYPSISSARTRPRTSLRRQTGITPITAMPISAEPTHFRWMCRREQASTPLLHWPHSYGAGGRSHDKWCLRRLPGKGGRTARRRGGTTG